VTGDHKMRSSDLLEACRRWKSMARPFSAFTFKQTLSAFMHL